MSMVFSRKTIYIFLITYISALQNAHGLWLSQDEVSILKTGGNTSTQTYGIESKNNYKADFNPRLEFNLNLSYLLNKTNDVISAEKWDVLLSHEKAITNKYSLLIAEKVESNRFAGIRRRYNSDIAMKYFFTKKKSRTFYVEAGYRYMEEETTIANSSNDYISKGRLFSYISNKLNDNVASELSLEYLPTISESNDYLLNIVPSLSVVMTKKLSLKLSYKWNYDSTPIPGNSSTDYIFSTGILANF